MVSLGSRLAKGWNTILTAMQTTSPQDRSLGMNSMNVNKVQYALGGQPDGGFSQPVWGAEISTVGQYSREGYTSKTIDRPVVPFTVQVEAMVKDEDIQLAINHLASQITGGEHYWKSQSNEFTDVMTKFCRDIDFDWIDTILVKECLAFGNSYWKPRLGIKNIRNREDLMHLPISSMARVWWDRQRRAYKFEFRGSEYQGYHNPQDIIPFIWNPINASAFGQGFITALTSTRPFVEVTPNGILHKELPSILDRKYSTAMTMHITERRYIPHNVYQALDANQEERDTLANSLSNLETGQDHVVGSKVEVTELGSSQRAFDPTMFTDLTQGAVFKALNDFMGKQASSESHQYANAKESSMLVDIGLASFPLAITRQLIEKLFQPWYEAQGGIIDPNYGGGLVSVPWEEFEPVLNFGQVEKKNLDVETKIKLIELGISSGALQDIIEIRELLEDAGLGLRKEFTDTMNQQYNNYGAVPPEMTQPAQELNPVDRWMAQMGEPPMTDPNYTSSQKDFEPILSMDATLGDAYSQGINPQPSDPRINFTIPPKGLPAILKKYPSHGSGQLKNKKVKGLKGMTIGDLNTLLSNTDSQ